MLHVVSCRTHSNHGAPGVRRIFKLQILRAVACNIVKHRDFYPTKEVLLKHSMSYLGMFDEFKGASACLVEASLRLLLALRWGCCIDCASRVRQGRLGLREGAPPT